MSIFGGRDRVIRAQVHERLLVTMDSGQTFDGLLVDADASTLMLANASVVSADGSKVPADGHIYLPRFDVSYMQRP